MSIQATDLVWYLSTLAGNSGFSSVAGGPGTSLGKYMSATPIINGFLDNVFNDVTGNQNFSQGSDYQCIFVANMNYSSTLINPVVWISQKSVGGTTILIAKDVIGPTTITSSSPQASFIPIDTVVPTGIGQFSSPISQNSGILLGSIGPQQCVPVWIQRQANNTAQSNLDTVTLTIAGGALT